ncbi:MBL fold metallo-hydrolase [Pedobacter sp. MW01-1-1]|uniref:MBL fold metallo-hydrolase n=1 Tax=Pedobacter sp. MW01-1-1 TaxID=3383027 RepID=UPI003FF08F5A
MIAIYSILFIILLFFFILQLPVFGAFPKGTRLQAIKQLANYKDGAIQNLSVTLMKPENVSYFTMFKEFFTGKDANNIPKKALPFVQPEIDALQQTTAPEIIWFGHSSYLIKVAGLRVLVDPVFSSTPSPFSFLGNKAFKGTQFAEAEDFKNIDVLVLTHDHYDHLDYQSVLKIAPQSKQIVTSLGLGAHLEKWGIQSAKIKELNWGQSINLFDSLTFTAVPARHFTGRTFKRNQTLWSAFVLKTINASLFLGGDSGYDTHFKEIGALYGPFDLALLECGQYNAYWPNIHMFPEEVVEAAKDLKARVLMPVHWGKFTLAMHAWDDSVKRVTAEAARQNFPIATPKLGATWVVNSALPTEKWWENT